MTKNAVLKTTPNDACAQNEKRTNADCTKQENDVVELKREVGLLGGISFIVGGIIGKLEKLLLVSM